MVIQEIHLKVSKHTESEASIAKRLHSDHRESALYGVLVGSLNSEALWAIEQLYIDPAYMLQTGYMHHAELH